MRILSLNSFSTILDEIFRSRDAVTLQDLTERLVTKKSDEEVREPLLFFQFMSLQSAQRPWAFEAELEVCESAEVVKKLRPNYIKAREVVKAFLLAYASVRIRSLQDEREKDSLLKRQKEEARQELLSQLTGSLHKNRRLKVLGSMLGGEDTEVNRLCEMCGFRFRLHTIDMN